MSLYETSDMQATLIIEAIPDFPVVKAGDDIAQQIGDALAAASMSLQDGDIIVLAQKIVSLSEGRTVQLDDVEVSAAAEELAAQTDKDPRIVELILQESDEVIRSQPGVIIARHRLGLIGANAGIDQSNIDHANGECALLLPEDPDQSAIRLRQALTASTGKRVGVVISDSMNRPWRLGTIGTAIGSAAQRESSPSSATASPGEVRVRRHSSGCMPAQEPTRPPSPVCPLPAPEVARTRIPA